MRSRPSLSRPTSKTCATMLARGCADVSDTKHPLSLPTPEAIEEQLRLLAQPVDFDALVAAGILTKVGAWWAVADMKSLPAHVAVKVSESKIAGGRTLVKLRKASARR